MASSPSWPLKQAGGKQQSWNEDRKAVMWNSLGGEEQRAPVISLGARVSAHGPMNANAALLAWGTAILEEDS